MFNDNHTNVGYKKKVEFYTSKDKDGFYIGHIKTVESWMRFPIGQPPFRHYETKIRTLRDWNDKPLLFVSEEDARTHHETKEYFKTLL